MSDKCVIDINSIESQIDKCVIDFFAKYNIDLNDLSQTKSIPHNTLTLCMMSIYKDLFKPDKTQIYNKNSLIDYDNNDLLKVIANKFIELSIMFNKSMGLMQFSIMTGIHRETLATWRDNEKLNPIKSDIIKNICECHKMEQISLLNDSPVGALAVANNDTETGLEWSKNQVQQITTNQVFYLPSERSDRLKLDSPN